MPRAVGGIFGGHFRLLPLHSRGEPVLSNVNGRRNAGAGGQTHQGI